MTKTHHSIVEQPHERGSALIGVLLLLMMMSALVAALAVSGQTETLISGNQRAGAQAEAAAEAGLNHAVELATTFIFEWKTNGFGSTEAAIDALLLGPDLDSGTPDTNADNGSLAAGGARVGITAGEDIPLGTRLTIAAGITAQYEAFIMDDDATAPDENGDPLIDANTRLLVRATGYGPNNTRVTLEAVISPFPLPGVVTNGPLEINGNSVILDGTGAGVHSNSDLTINGNGDDLGGTISTSGTYDGPDDIGTLEGVPQVSLPEIRASDYRAHADFILTSAGTMTNQAGTVQCTYSSPPPSPCNNWSFDSGTGGWNFANAAPPAGTYYVEGDVTVSSGPTVQISIIAEGSIKISGSPTMTPHTPELLFVTDKDLKITGSLDAADPDINVQGQMLVHGQADIFGKIQLAGQLIIEDADVGDLVATGGNSIGGNVTITYNGGLGGSTFSVTGWREDR